MTHPDDVLRELHHRVKNNFQIIASLLNLQKRLLPKDRREDLRFIEEHVQAMAIAHQVMYASPAPSSVPVHLLVSEVLDSLRQIAGCPLSGLVTDLVAVERTMGLDQSIALCLYLAVAVPPYIDRAMAAPGAAATVTLTLDGAQFTLTIAGDWSDPIEFDSLRSRLTEAYLRQLSGEAAPANPALPGRSIRFSLDAGRISPSL